MNCVFVSAVTDEHFKDDLALTRLYLQVFFPQDVGEAEKLCKKNKREDLFKKLSANFHAINPLKMKRGKAEELVAKPVDYKTALTKFYNEHDKEKVQEVDGELSKAKGKEAILFAVLAEKHNAPNALNAVFEERVKDAVIEDYGSLLKLYLSIFYPACASIAKSMLVKYRGGKESELFSKLSTKFHSFNPLEMEALKHLGKPSMSTIEEAETACTCASPVPRKAPRTVPMSPAVTP